MELMFEGDADSGEVPAEAQPEEAAEAPARPATVEAAPIAESIAVRPGFKPYSSYKGKIIWIVVGLIAVAALVGVVTFVNALVRLK